LQGDAGIEMQRAFGAETEAVPADRRVAGIAAVEELARRLGDAIGDPPAQRFADVDVLARHAKRHELLPAPAGSPIARRLRAKRRSQPACRGGAAPRTESA